MNHATAAVFVTPGAPLELRGFAVPSPAGEEVLVRVTACTLCGSDVHSWAGRRAVPRPTVLGHEIMGRVEAFGPDASRVDHMGRPLAEGDRVTWAIVASCGACFACSRGLPQKCAAATKYGHEAFAPGDARRALTGGLAEVCLLARGTAIFRVPDALADAVAAPASCATATVAAVLDAAGLGAPREANARVEAVLVMGAGMLGLTACAMARAAGASVVVACDKDAARLALARAFGATDVALPEELGAKVRGVAPHGVDAALELTGVNEPLASALASLRVGGTLVLAGAVYPTPPFELFPEQIVRRMVTLRGVHNYAPRHLAAALRFLAGAPELPFASLVSTWLPLSRVNEALETAHAGGALRVGVLPDASAAG